jgi:hypothetical protein
VCRLYQVFELPRTAARATIEAIRFCMVELLESETDGNRKGIPL